ncbi:SDR family NAD(P)-dependent oxidoreductase [Streptomyces sp. NPDC000410]|uniref:SDR family NAD(P)-dependent oxidoreductase n=1 Tax=Streptomyces sp. NPDC000410 TaxID=3154254 RepID=UPI00333332CC
MRITGSTVLLTGVTGGIGAALAAELSARGAKLILTGRRPDALEPLVERYDARGVVADLADPDDVERLAREAAGTEILIANAALPSSGELLDYTPDQIDRSLAVNLRAPVMLARLLAPAMAEARRGHLAFVGSMSGKTATKYSALYDAGKFGLRGFALSLRQDLHERGVGVSIIQPGFVRDAGMFAATGAEAPAGLRTVSPRQVVAGVVRSIEQDRAEVNVAPVEMKVLTAIGGQFPGFSERVQRRASGAEGTVRRIVEAQRDNR